jgi:hypothetical protein
LIQREWLDLKGLVAYAAVSERTLRQWIHRGVDALPASQVDGKILVKVTKFDEWLESHPVARLEAVNVGAVVDEFMADLRKQ